MCWCKHINSDYNKMRWPVDPLYIHNMVIRIICIKYEMVLMKCTEQNWRYQHIWYPVCSFHRFQIPLAHTSIPFSSCFCFCCSQSYFPIYSNISACVDWSANFPTVYRCIEQLMQAITYSTRWQCHFTIFLLSGGCGAAGPAADQHYLYHSMCYIFADLHQKPFGLQK